MTTKIVVDGQWGQLKFDHGTIGGRHDSAHACMPV